MLVGVVLLFALGNILCGFAKSAVWLFISRGVSGVGGGGINSLVMIVISDIVSMKERGKYQGLIGAAVATGSGIVCQCCIS
jgi:MFS family permease